MTIQIVRHYHDKSGIATKGGLCVVAHHDKGDSFYTIMTSVCSSADQYSRKVAHENISAALEAGNFIKLPLPSWYNRNKVTREQLLEVVDQAFLNVVGSSYAFS